MTSIKAPPVYEPLSRDDEHPAGVASLPWILFFNSLFNGDTGTQWSPVFTSLTTVGSPTITGKAYRIGRSLVFFRVTIVPGTSTTSVAGTTYINNFPFIMAGDGICFAVSGLLGSNSGMCDLASNRVYVPGWSAVTVPLSIIGIVEAT